MELFENIAEECISDIIDGIERTDTEHIFEIEMKDNVLRIETPKGIYIINTNKYLKEIWVSSPISGPHHFKFQANLWLNRNNEEIIELLNNEFALIGNIKISDASK